MSIIESVLIALGLSPGKELADSMRESKTLTIMIILGLVLFAGFALFLLHMAGKQ
ncbi:hypothetical protein [Thalassomonas sp. RHCl1]|uniref:hypothetical protein n=1 Tax=Thalassomonas sp. RHCl1 TaxID=2995320 RepID=UPI00248C15A7|nr:hypothetical protein [Thalassomonas sp. RHCl1]